MFRNSLFTRTGSQGFSAGEGRVVALARLHSVRKCLGTSSLSIDIKSHKFYLFDRVPFGMKRLWMGNSGCVLFNTSRAFEKFPRVLTVGVNEGLTRRVAVGVRLTSNRSR